MLGPAFDLFLILITSSFELRAVYRSVLCHLSPRPVPPAPQSLSHNLRRRCSSSMRQARRWVYYFLCSARNDRLSIDRSVCPLVRLARGCSRRLLYRCSTSSRHIITERPLVDRGGGPGRPTLWQVVPFAHLLSYHRLYRRRSVRGSWTVGVQFILDVCILHLLLPAC